MDNCTNSTNKPTHCFKYNGYVGKSSQITVSSIMSPLSNVHIDNFDKSTTSEINFLTKACTKNNNDSPSSTTSTATISNMTSEASTLKKRSLNAAKHIGEAEKHINIHKADTSSYPQAFHLKTDRSPSAALPNEKVFDMESDATYSKLVTSTKSYVHQNDIEDEININAIKDCLMNQRVPESCV